MDAARGRGGARRAGRAKARDEARKLREKAEVVDDAPAGRPTTPCARPPAPTCPIPEPPFWGAREIEVDLDDVFPYLDRHVLFKLHWGGRGKKGEEWRRIVEGHDGEEGFAPRLERMWREQDYLRPRARLGYFPAATPTGNELIVFDPEDPERELERLVFPRQPRHDRICLADFYRPLDSGERDVVALQGVTVGDRGHRADGAARGATASSPSSSTRTAWACRPPRAWPSGCTPRRAASWASSSTRAAATRGATRPARTSPSTRRSGACSTSRRSACTLSDGYAVMPEQSTVAIVAHHPQAVYFGMKSGFIPEDKTARRADRGHRARRRAAARGGSDRGLGRGRSAGRRSSRLGSLPRAVGLRSGSALPSRTASPGSHRRRPCAHANRVGLEPAGSAHAVVCLKQETALRHPARGPGRRSRHGWPSSWGQSATSPRWGSGSARSGWRTAGRCSRPGAARPRE